MGAGKLFFEICCPGVTSHSGRDESLHDVRLEWLLSSGAGSHIRRHGAFAARALNPWARSANQIPLRASHSLVSLAHLLVGVAHGKPHPGGDGLVARQLEHHLTLTSSSVAVFRASKP